MFFSIIGQAIIGWLIADFLSGLFHFIGDSTVTGNTKLVRLFAGFNQDHHRDPLAITRETFIKRNLTQLVLVSVVAVIWLLTVGFSVVWMFAVLGGLLIAEVHKWSHSPKTANAFIRVLQEIGIFQSPKSHASHHRPPHLVNYCVLSNFVNPVVDKVKLWRGFERVMSRN